MPQTFNYNDYKNAWYRAFLLQPNVHSWFFNFHEQCTNIFPVWFFHWWTMFGCIPAIFPAEAKEDWDCWLHSNLTMDPYMKEVHFVRQFCVAWIFSWEYRLQPFLPPPYPLSLVRIYKVKWRPEFKTQLCGKENVDYFCKYGKRKFTLHNLHLFVKSKVAPATPAKKEMKREKSSSSSTKTKAKGLSQKERDLLEYLKDDSNMKQIMLQKILDKQGDSDDETASSAASSSPPKPQDLQDSQDPYEL